MLKPQFKLLVVAILAVLVALGPALTAAQGPYDPPPERATAGTMFMDVVAIRPVGIASMAFGIAVYLVSLPFSLPAGSAGDVWEKLVLDPTRYTFQRPLGEI